MAAEKPERTGDRLLAYATLAPSALLLILLAAVPTVTVVLFALQRIEIGELTGTWVGVKNFACVLQSPDFYNGLWNSFVWVFGSVALEMLLGTGIALLLNQAFVGRGAAR